MEKPDLAAARGQIDILNALEEVLVDEGRSQMVWATQKGSFTWCTVERARELSAPPPPGEPTEEERHMAIRLIAAAPGDHARLAELIAGEFARRRSA